MQRIVLFSGVLALGVIAGPSLHAQHSDAAAAIQSVQVAYRWNRPHLLERPARLNIDSVSVATALTALSRASGVNIVFSPSMLPARPHVSCACQGATVETALRVLLANTGFRYAAVDDKIVVEPMARADSDLPKQSPAFAAKISGVIEPAAFVGTITGTVTDLGTGQPLPRADVSVVGTRLGATADAAGKYRIVGVTAGQVELHARLIGYKVIDRTVSVGDGQTVTVNFAMETAPLSLNAVVVTGTAGGTKAREVGNALAQINPVDQKDQPILNVGQLIGQNAPGIMVMPVAGNVGSGSAINIRGAMSLSLNSQPIIYVDGVRINNSTSEGPAIREGRPVSRLNDFNPEDIASIQIIKGPAASTLYGTEASNGVIQIITKHGASGAPKLDIMMREGANWLADARDKLGMVYGKDPTTQLVDSFSVFDLYKQQNNGQELFTVGPLRSVNANLSGGTDAIRYFMSGEMSKNQGIVPYNWENVGSARVNLSLIPSTTWKVNLNMNFTQSQTRFAQAADQFGIWDMSVWASPSLLGGNTHGWRYALPSVAASVDSRSKVNRFTGGLDVTNSPWAWFTQEIKVGTDIGSNTNQVLFPRVPDGQINFQGARVGGEKTLENVTIPYYTLDYSATVKKDVVGLTTATSVGAQYYRHAETDVTAVGDNFPTPAVTTIGGAASTVANETFVESKSLGFYVQETFGSQDRRFLTAAVRGDGNSAFGKDYKAAYYPKLSGSWVLSEEPFFKNLRLANWVSSLRPRFSWGQAGQQPDAFAALRLYSPITGPGANPAVSPSSIGNPALKPERGTELELGFDMGLGGDRVTIEYTHYRRKTTDAIVQVPVHPETGFPGSQILNLGETRNWGNEVGMNIGILRRENLGWNLNLNYSTANSMVDDLGGVTLQNYRVGYPIASVFMVRVVHAEFDASGRLTNVLCDGGPGKAPVSCNGAPQVYWGVSAPTQLGSMANSVTLWKKLNLTATVDFQLGQHSQDGDISFANTNFQNTAKIWTGAPDPVFAAYQSVAPRGPLGYYNASFVKLRALSASYTLPSRLARSVGAQSASLAAAWNNVALLWRKQEYAYGPGGVRVPDPETRNPGSGQNPTYQTVIPPLSSAMFTVRLSY